MELGWFIFGFVMGLVLGGVSISFWHDVKKPYGVLRIDHSDPTKDVYRFELSDLRDVTKRKRIILDVDNDADISRR